MIYVARLICKLNTLLISLYRNPPINNDIPVGAFFPSLAFTLHPEGTDMWSVAFVIGCGTCELQQHVTDGLCLAKWTHRCCAISVSNLSTQSITDTSVVSVHYNMWHLLVHNIVVTLLRQHIW